MKKLRDKLCVFSGEDFYIISQCSLKIQIYFSTIGAFVLAILVCCFISAFLFTDSLFHNPIQDFGIALVWGVIVTNLYVLLLYTISPTLLPVSKHNKKRESWTKTKTFNGSLILRVLLLILLAIIIAQPLNVALFSSNVDAYANTIKKLLSNHIGAWLVTMTMAVIFLLPVYWKYAIRNLGGFYEQKAKIEKRIITDGYSILKQNFKKAFEYKIHELNKKTWERLMPYLQKLKVVDETKYNSIFTEIEMEIKSEKIEKYEYWADPPFRTVRKSKLKYLTEQDFLTEIYKN